LNRIVSIKINTLFLSAILIAGTIALSSPSFMAGAQAQQDYGIENNYDKKSNGKDVSVKSIKCNNVNVNVNGLELNGLPPFLNNLLASDGQDGYGDASSYGSGSYGNVGQSGYDNNSFKFVCINNNNNTVIGEGEEPIPPEPTKAQLNVTKLVTCQETDGSSLVPSIQQISLNCDDLLALITEDQFTITVTDTNVSPSNFNGSETGTLVTLDAGPFTVTEEPYDSVAEDVETLEDIQTDVTGPFPSFSGDCTQTGTGSFSATGDIAAGGQETCNVVNNFVMTRSEGFTAGSSIIAQGTADSSELTALEKVEKLKKQWLELLP